MEGENNLDLSVKNNKTAIKFSTDHQIRLQSAVKVFVSRSTNEQKELPQSEYTFNQDIADKNGEKKASICKYSS